VEVLGKEHLSEKEKNPPFLVRVKVWERAPGTFGPGVGLLATGGQLKGLAVKR
jgi:hypothetical protein